MKALVTLGAVLACATNAASQTPAAASGTGQAAVERPSDPPVPPADASQDQLRAWIDRYVDKGAWLEAAVDGKRVILYDPASLVKLPDGHVVASVRSELFRPVADQGHALRSVRKKLVIDCADLRYKELVFEGYAGANLQTPVPGLPTPDSWTKPLAETSTAGMVNRKICGAVDARR